MAKLVCKTTNWAVDRQLSFLSVSLNSYCKLKFISKATCFKLQYVASAFYYIFCYKNIFFNIIKVFQTVFFLINMVYIPNVHEYEEIKSKVTILQQLYAFLFVFSHFFCILIDRPKVKMLEILTSHRLFLDMVQYKSFFDLFIFNCTLIICKKNHTQI